MKTIYLSIALLIYATAIIAANLIVVTFGPWITPVNSFFLVGLDLSLRDWLNVKLKSWQMMLLIMIASCLTYLLNPASEMIAVASSVAFMVAALTDWMTFTALKGSWLFKANGSNIVGSAIDSLLFPTIAFGILLPHIIAFQFLAKVAGGALWAALFALIMKDKLTGD